MIIPSQGKTIVILGNGFDLDLGLDTSYSSFISSEAFRLFLGAERDNRTRRYASSVTRQYGLMHFIQQESAKSHWFDLELSLAKYARKGYVAFEVNGNLYSSAENSSNDEIEQMYNHLVIALHKYLTDIDYNHIRPNSLAAKLLAVISERDDIDIWSFNYTDLNKLCPYLGIDIINCPITHVHGSLSSNDIILGFHNDAQIDESYHYMRKIENVNHHFSGYTSRLIEADKLVIFGHSLGITDQDYFSDYFDYLTHPQDYKHRQIDIYSKNLESISRLRERINEMSSNRLSKIIGNTTINFIKTERDT